MIKTKNEELNNVLENVQIRAQELADAIKNGNKEDFEDLSYILKGQLTRVIGLYEEAIDRDEA